MKRSFLNRYVIAGTSLLAISVSAHALTVPPEIEQQYKAAIEARAIGDLYESIDQLNSLLTNNPGMHRARLELAVTYYRAARYEEARQHATRVLADPSTPNSVKETVTLFVEQLDSLQEAESERRHSWSVFMGIGAGYDDNVNAGPGIDAFEVNGLQFVLDPSSGEQSDAFTSYSARLHHSYRMPGSVNIGARPVQMLWQNRVSVYRKEYQDEHPYTVDVITASTGMALASRTNWRAAVDVKVDHVRLGDDSLVQYVSLNPSYTLIYGKNEFNFRAQWMDRNYDQKKDRDREGERVLFGLDYTRDINTDVALKFGATTYTQDGRKNYEEFEVQEGYASGLWSAWEGGALYLRVSYRETEYDGLEPVFNIGRDEEETRYVLGVSHNFKAGSLEGWGVSGRVSYSDNESNIDIFEYDRNLVSLELTKRF